MSAFILSQEHIAAMLQVTSPQYPGDGFYHCWQGQPQYKSREEMGQLLLEQNYRSVNYRYDSKDSPPQFHHVTRREYTPVEIIKACDCYVYQSCETPDWKDTEARELCETLRDRAINRLPGYHKAKWGIDC